MTGRAWQELSTSETGLPDGSRSVAVASARSDVAGQLEHALVSSGHVVERCVSLDELLLHLPDVDLLLVDPDLPPAGADGACAAIRKLCFLPLMVAGRSMTEAEQIRCLDQGADDVLHWPTSERELLARVRAHLRRHSMQPPQRKIMLGGGRVLDLENSLALVDGQALALTPTEARLLRALSTRLGCPYPVRELIGAVWDDSYLASGTTDMLRANVYRLRRKLEVDPRTPQFLRFVSGQGWLLSPATEAETPQTPATTASRVQAAS